MEVHEGLYYLSLCRNTKELVRKSMSHNMHQCNALATLKPRNGQDESWSIHKRLGHPPFQILKFMFHDEFTRFPSESIV